MKLSNNSIGANNLSIPLNSLAFDIDGVVADIMTTFLDLARERYNCGHHLRYEHITAFRLEDCLDLEPDIIRTLIRELIDRPHELAVEPIPQAVPVLTRLARETPLVFVTARDRAAPIQTWLQRHLPQVPPNSIPGSGHRRPPHQDSLPPGPPHPILRGRSPGNLPATGPTRRHPHPLRPTLEPPAAPLPGSGRLARTGRPALRIVLMSPWLTHKL